MLFQEECSRPLKEFADQINKRPRHPEIREDVHLSMFILAEVHVNMPAARTSSVGSISLPLNYFSITGLSLLALIFMNTFLTGGILNTYSYWPKQISMSSKSTMGSGFVSIDFHSFKNT